MIRGQHLCGFRRLGAIVEDRKYFYGLDCVRFAAALIVSVFHLGLYSWASHGSTTADIFDHASSYPGLTPWVWFGWMGVEVFFVVSGFVIANSANGAAPIAFAKGRVLRLLPAAWICAVLSVIAVAVVGHQAVGETAIRWLRAVTLSPEGPWIDGVYWSLGVEVGFYGLIFLLLMTGRFSRLPILAWLLLAVSGVFLIWRTVEPPGSVGGVHLPYFLVNHADELLLNHGAYFAGGIWLWILSRRAMSPWDWLGLTGAFLVGGFQIWIVAHDMVSTALPAVYGRSADEPLLFWVIAFAGMAAMTRWPGRFTPRSARLRGGLRTLGLATYPYYLVHNVIGAALARAFILNGLAPYEALALALACVICLAFAIATLAERDARRLLGLVVERLGRRWRKVAWLARLRRRADIIPAASPALDAASLAAVHHRREI